MLALLIKTDDTNNQSASLDYKVGLIINSSIPKKVSTRKTNMSINKISCYFLFLFSSLTIEMAVSHQRLEEHRKKGSETTTKLDCV